MVDDTSTFRLPDAVRHFLCVMALMWTGIVNGQPFFFADTTNYIRAADMAVYLGSGRTISTVWTDRYRSALPNDAGVPGKSTGQAIHQATGNNLSTGLVMSGRSPYIGALMYLGWVSGWFWPFVLLQAALSYVLILMVLRCFDVDTPRSVVLCTLILAFATSLPTYNSLLLADGFASFGILAFAIIAMATKIDRRELVFLIIVSLVSVIAHLTHLMMLLGEVALLLLLSWLRVLTVPRRTWFVAVGLVLGGVIALQATAVATRMAVGKEPQLLPLLTARFYIDGPGRNFIEKGCAGRRFEVCRIQIVRPVNNAGWLFSHDPVEGVYMRASPESRLRMGQEDVAFAWAVIRHDPVGQISQSLLNAARQAIWIDYTGLNQGCFDKSECWTNLPPTVRNRFRQTPSGRNAWPESVLNAILYAAVITSLLSLIWTVRRMAQIDRLGFEQIRTMLVVVGAGMMMCSFLGGAVADPQYRYQGRLIWLIPLMALVALLRLLRVGASQNKG